MVAIAELFIAIAAFVIELLLHLFALFLNLSESATRVTGAKRAAYVLGAVCALHLFLGIVLSISFDLQHFLLSPLFSWPAMIVSTLLLVIAILTPVALDIAKSRRDHEAVNASEGTARPRVENAKPPMLLSYGVSAILVAGLFSTFSAQSTRVSLKDRLCDAANAGMREQVKARGNAALTFTEKLLKIELRNKLPCQPKPD